MLFNSIEFLFGFLPVTYVVFWLLPTTRSRYIWLTISGYVFYGWWDARFTLLMAFSTAVSFFSGLAMTRYPVGSRARRLCLVIPITVDLALLAFFKYANFALSSISDGASLLGVPIPMAHLDIVLPIGISFYTFHTISYIIDSYKGTIRPTRDFWEFATYVSLFSQLVAGPIVRFRQIEADLEAIGTQTRTKWLGRGVSFFCIGLIEKVLIADTLAALVDPSFANWQGLSTGGAWLAALGYSFQLLFDFSGYSSMAVGLGFLFGIRIPQNFNSPYKARNPSEFWERWHISLSSCLRDYLYIPMGGNRKGMAKTYRNLMLTMLIGGLWHGASWMFVAWGAYHGLLLSLYRISAEWWDRLPVSVRQGAMFILVLLGWLLFRSTSFAMAIGILTRMVIPTAGMVAANVNLAVAAGTMAIAAWWSMRGRNAFEMEHAWSTRRRVLMAIAVGAGLALIVTARPSPFLYFQF